MTMEERIKNDSAINKPIPGKFPPRPDDAKTLYQWMRQGMFPKDEATIHVFQMNDNVNGYGYYLECEVREMTKEELDSRTSSQKGQKKTKEDPSPKQKQESKRKVQSKSECYLVTPEEWETKEIVVIDTETTGRSAKWDELLQVSAADNHGHTYDQYVRPVRHKSWPSAMEVNHITPEMVAGSPSAQTLVAVWQSLFDQADYIIGHNVCFDIRFLEAIGVQIDPEKVIDTCKLHRMLYPKAENHKLDTAVMELASEEIKAQYADGAHNAIVDVLGTLDVYHAFCKQAWEKQ